MRVARLAKRLIIVLLLLVLGAGIGFVGCYLLVAEYIVKDQVYASEAERCTDTLWTLRSKGLAAESVEPDSEDPARRESAPERANDAQLSDSPSGALDPLEGRLLGPHVRTVFRCWVVLFALVGAQMGWVRRPFIGDPEREFQWFRARESNFFEAVWHSLLSFLS